MILYIVRHGDPIYDPDSLTPLGHRQAEAVSRRFTTYGLDEIYASTCVRAQLTAKPTCEILGKDMTTYEWMSENFAWDHFSTRSEKQNGWVFIKRRTAMRSKEMKELGDEWYKHPAFADTDAEAGYRRLCRESDAFFAKLGYVNDRENGCYRAENHNDKRVAVFCHGGFGASWLGAILNLPLPLTWSTFCFGLTGVFVIQFSPDSNGLVVPEVLTANNEAHLIAENLPGLNTERRY